MRLPGKSGRASAGVRCRCLLIVLASAFFMCACVPSANFDADKATRDIFAMDTYMTVGCWGPDCEAAADAAVEEIHRIDALLSISSAGGDIYRVNAEGEAAVCAETSLIVNTALEVFRGTDGAFDITVYPVMRLWGFTDGNLHVPEQAELDEVLSHVGSEKLSLEDGVLKLNDASGIDLGGIAKGYTSDRLVGIFKEYGITSACVSLGGNVHCLGTKTDGSAWRCGIVDPFNKDSGYLGVLTVTDRAVITSGSYERFFVDEAAGERYHHIIDPKTGRPAESGLASVTIVHKRGILADALSTACYVLGFDGAIRYWNASGRDFDMIIMTDGGELYITPGIADSFTSDYTVNTIG